MATAAYHYTSDQSFYRRMAVFVAGIIVFGFAQWALRGFVNVATVPVWVHLHGMAFMGWVVLFVVQNVLAERGSIAMHRRLGWLAVALAVFMVGIGSFTSIRAIELHRQPFFFSPAFFLALTQVQVAVFGAMVAAAIATRRQTDWHRRLMLGATVLIMEPAFGRLLPAPLIGAETTEWITAAIQVGILGFAMRHDRSVLGRVHPALVWSAGAVLFMHGAVSLGSRLPFVADVANALAGGGGAA